MKRWASVVGVVMSVTLVAAAPQRPVFKTGVDLVNVGVTVTDKKGNLVRDLRPQDFELFEDGARQEVKYFAQDDSSTARPELHLGLLFDTSGSMQEDITFSRSAAVKFLNQLADAVDITLVDFDTEVRVARYGQNDFARLIERIRMRKADGWTALYDALGVYLDGADGQEGRKVLVLYTDGGDTRSSMSYSNALDLLRASDVTVYAIGFLEHQLSSAQFDQRIKLERIAEVTGGQAFFPRSIKDLEGTYAKVESEIRAQYSLGYLSSNTQTDGRWRKLEVKVRRSGVKVRSRHGYFAPYKPR